MAGTVCRCDSGLVNSGIPSCVDGFSRIAKLVFVYKKANDGSSNAVKCSETIDQAFLDSKLNEADPSKRWYITDNISSITEVRNDPTTESVDNIDFIVEQGSRTFQGFFLGKAASTPTYLKFLKSAECPSVMYFGIDVNGTLIGAETIVDDEIALDGIPIQDKTMYSRPVPATATTAAKNEINFTVEQLFRDETIGYISAQYITADLLNATGLLDVTLTEGSTASTLSSVSVDAELVYGSLCNKLAFSGATQPEDWEVNNITTPASITVLTATENPDGTYELTFAPQATSDSVTVEVAKNGFESNVVTIALPTS